MSLCRTKAQSPSFLAKDLAFWGFGLGSGRAIHICAPQGPTYVALEEVIKDLPLLEVAIVEETAAVGGLALPVDGGAGTRLRSFAWVTDGIRAEFKSSVAVTRIARCDRRLSSCAEVGIVRKRKPGVHVPRSREPTSKHTHVNIPQNWELLIRECVDPDLDVLAQ